MKTVNAYVGLDVHRDTIAVAVADEHRRGEVRFHGNVPNTPTDLQKLVRRLSEQHDEITRRGHAATTFTDN